MTVLAPAIVVALISSRIVSNINVIKYDLGVVTFY